MREDKNRKRTEIRPGFTIQDENFLRKYDNPKANPDIQIFTNESFEPEEKELREYYCACCKSRLDYHEHLDVWLCPECLQQYDPQRRFDTPLRDKKDFGSGVYPELQTSPTWDEDDPNLPFVEGIDFGEEQELDSNNVEILRDGERIKHIRVKGLPAEALAVMNELDGKD